MISSLEVGARFIIQDDASPALKRIADELKIIQEQLERTKAAFTSLARTTFAGVTERLQAVNTELKSLGDLGAGAADKMALSFDRATASMSASLARVSEQMARIAVQGAEIGVIGRAKRAAARGGAGGGFSMYAPTGIHGVHYGTHDNVMMGGLIAAGALGYGMWEEAELEDRITTVFQSSLGMGPDGKPYSLANPNVQMQDDPMFKRVRDAIMGSYTRTGMPLSDITKGYESGTRILAPLNPEDRMSILEGIMPYATQEAKAKDISVDEAVRAMTGLAHMGGQYGVPQVIAMAKHLAYVSTTTDADLNTTMRAASYIIPLLRVSGFQPDQLLSMVTALQRGGVTSTKSGTWINNMFQRSFLPVLPPNPSKMQAMQHAQRLAELERLGLADANGKPTFLDKDGNPDAYLYMDKLTSLAKSVDKKTAESYLQYVTGQQGQKSAAFFRDPTNAANIRKSAAEEAAFETGEAAWDYRAKNSPMQTLRTTWANFNAELMHTGAAVLPYVTRMLKAANEELGGKGELTVAGGALVAWMTKGMWGPIAASISARVITFLAPYMAALAPLILKGDTDPHAKDAGANGRTNAQVLRGLIWGDPQGPEDAVETALNTARKARDKAAGKGPVRWHASSLDPGDYERAYRAEQEYRADPEAAHGRAYSAMSAASPPVQVTSNVQIAANPVTVTLNGAAIGSAVMSWIVKDARQVFGSSSFDGASHPSSVDHGIVGHH